MIKKRKVVHLGDMLQEKDNEMNSFHITTIEQHNIIYSAFFMCQKVVIIIFNLII